MQQYNKVVVFLSYSQKDKKEILAIENALVRAGILEDNIFLDIRSITPGTNWVQEIRESIEGVNLCLFLWTNNIKDSEIIESERKYAQEVMMNREFINKGKDAHKSPQYYVIDIIGENLEPTLKKRLQEHKDIQQIRFENKDELFFTINEKIKEKLSPIFLKIQEPPQQIDEKIIKKEPSGAKDTKEEEKVRKGIMSVMEIASDFNSRHQYRNALLLYQKAKKEVDDNPSALDASEKISLSLSTADLSYLLANYTDALREYEKILDESVRSIGNDALLTLRCRTSLADVYNDLEDYEKAEKLLKEVQLITAKKLGDDHPETVKSVSNLAALYIRQKKYEEANILLEEVRLIAIERLEEGQPETVKIINSLAMLYIDQGEYEKAEHLSETLLAKNRKRLGEAHPVILESISKLALAYFGQKDFKKAQQLFEEVVDQETKILGEKHPDTLKNMDRLGRAFLNQGDYVKGLYFLEKIRTERTKIFGNKHPKTLEIMLLLGRVYGFERNYRKALPLLEKSVKEIRSIFGLKHSKTLHSINIMIQFYKRQEMYIEAQMLVKQTIEEMK